MRKGWKYTLVIFALVTLIAFYVFIMGTLGITNPFAIFIEEPFFTGMMIIGAWGFYWYCKYHDRIKDTTPKG